MKSVFFATLLTAGLASAPSLAGEAEVRACSAKLSPQAQLIVKTLIPKLKPGFDARKAMRSTVIGLVRSGKIPRSTARTEAQAASQCLKQMKG